jgi:hypothetical protein
VIRLKSCQQIKVRESWIHVLNMDGRSSLCQFFYHDVESVDPLSTDKSYELIGMDMPDHDR